MCSARDRTRHSLSAESASCAQTRPALDDLGGAPIPRSGSLVPQAKRTALRLTPQRTDPATSTGLDPILILTNLEYWGSR